MAKPGVVILMNRSKPGVAERVESLRGWLAERVEILGEYSLDALRSGDGDPCRLDRFPTDLVEQAERAKMCIIFGGDGALLAAGRALANFGLPLLGVNMGKLGFLAEFSADDMQKHLDEILADRVQPTERIMLSVTLSGCDETFTCPVANDVAICAGYPFRMIDLHVAQGDDEVAQYFGDGLVVSTPTGSTGYNMSAGGPILEPTLEAVVITPIAPHTLSLRPMVLQPDKPIRVTATRVCEGTSIIVDGQVSRRLRNGSVAEIQRAKTVMRIIPHPGRSYFNVLASKLHWGLSPHHLASRQQDKS